MRIADCGLRIEEKKRKEKGSLFGGVFLFLHAVDGFVEEGDVAVNVGGIGFRRSADGVEPAVGVR